MHNTTDIPQHWELLSEKDKDGYKELQKQLSDLIRESGRSKFCKVFGQIVDILRKYIIRNEKDDSLRSLVCGILWMDDCLALNTRQLITTIKKCKSSINSGFQSIGYLSVPMEPSAAVELMHVFPFLKSNMSMTRQWTLRKKSGSIPSPKSEAENPVIVPNPLPVISQFKQTKENIYEDSADFESFLDFRDREDNLLSIDFFNGYDSFTAFPDGFSLEF